MDFKLFMAILEEHKAHTNHDVMDPPKDIIDNYTQLDCRVCVWLNIMWQTFKKDMP